MTSVNATAIIKQQAAPSGVVAAAPQPGATQVQTQGAGRKFGEAIAGVGGKAAEIGMNVAHTVAETAKSAALTTAEGGTNFVLEKGKEGFQDWLKIQLGHQLESICRFPFVGDKIAQIITQTLYPRYKEINPNTKMDEHTFQHMIKHGKVDELGEDFIPVFTSYLSQHLSKEEQLKLQEGSNLLLIKAFNKALYSKATEGIATVREPGGPRKIGNAIANWIPFVKKLPDSVRPWAGGAIGAIVAYKLAKFAFRIVKWGIAMIAGVTGLKFLANKFGGGAGAPPGLPAMPGEEAPAEGGGVMSKIMSGVNKAAQMASQVQGGGGHGAPGGGFGDALKALSGAAGGH